MRSFLERAMFRNILDYRVDDNVLLKCTGNVRLRGIAGMIRRMGFEGKRLHKLKK